MALGRPEPIILIVEEDALVSSYLADVIAEKAPVRSASFHQALARATAQNFDAAVIGIDDAGESAYPILDLLQRRGVPVVIYSCRPAASGLQDRFPGAVICACPGDDEEILQALEMAMLER